MFPPSTSPRARRSVVLVHSASARVPDGRRVIRVSAFSHAFSLAAPPLTPPFPPAASLASLAGS